jgi:hypothetical protein
MIASSLFHFTRRRSTIKKILHGFSFRASYSIENVREFGFEKPYLGIPMVCFCDIPLKFIRQHSRKYGGYGIGLTKEWAIKKKINPLHYLVKSSLVARSIKEMRDSLKESTFVASGESVYEIQRRMPAITNVQDGIVRLAAFTKVYEEKEVTFYSEREWRFVPEARQFSFNATRHKAVSDRLNRDYHSSDPDYLGFAVDDINHIIVPSAKAIIDVVEMINKLKLDQMTKLRLIQKV